MDEKLESLTKDKVVTLRLSPLDIYAANYIYQNGGIDNKYYEKCTDVFNSAVYDLHTSLNMVGDPVKSLNELRGRRDLLLKDKRFNGLTVANIAGTEIAYGKPYNIYMYSKILNDIQKYLIKNGDIFKPHSSWVTQLALTDTFIKLSKMKGEKIFKDEQDLLQNKLTDFEKFDLIEKFIKLFKDEEQNINKIKKIQDVIESEW